MLVLLVMILPAKMTSPPCLNGAGNPGVPASQHVAPRPRVQGAGLAGVMAPFPPPPPPPPTWNQHAGAGHFQPRGNPQVRATPPMPMHSPYSGRTSPRTPSTGGNYPLGRIPNIPMGQHWLQDEEHYDYQKLNGLTLPRTIRASSWSQLKDIEGCDPLTVPLSKLLYQGTENFWLRKAVRSMSPLWARSTKWSLLVRFLPKSAIGPPIHDSSIETMPSSISATAKKA